MGVQLQAEVCRKHSLGANLLRLWKSTFLERAHLVFDNEAARSAEQARIAELEQVLGRLTLENEILKKASSRLASLDMKPRPLAVDPKSFERSGVPWMSKPHRLPLREGP
jgi:transposase